MNNYVGPSMNRASELRSIANPIESIFPTAAFVLRGIAIELDSSVHIGE